MASPNRDMTPTRRQMSASSGSFSHSSSPRAKSPSWVTTRYSNGESPLARERSATVMAAIQHREEQRQAELHSKITKLSERLKQTDEFRRQTALALDMANMALRDADVMMLSEKRQLREAFAKVALMRSITSSRLAATMQGADEALAAQSAAEAAVENAKKALALARNAYAKDAAAGESLLHSSENAVHAANQRSTELRQVTTDAYRALAATQKETGLAIESATRELRVARSRAATAERNYGTHRAKVAHLTELLQKASTSHSNVLIELQMTETKLVGASPSSRRTRSDVLTSNSTLVSPQQSTYDDVPSGEILTLTERETNEVEDSSPALTNEGSLRPESRLWDEGSPRHQASPQLRGESDDDDLTDSFTREDDAIDSFDAEQAETPKSSVVFFPASSRIFVAPADTSGVPLACTTGPAVKPCKDAVEWPDLNDGKHELVVFLMNLGTTGEAHEPSIEEVERVWITKSNGFYTPSRVQLRNVFELIVTFSSKRGSDYDLGRVTAVPKSSVNVGFVLARDLPASTKLHNRCTYRAVLPRGVCRLASTSSMLVPLLGDVQVADGDLPRFRIHIKTGCQHFSDVLLGIGRGGETVALLCDASWSMSEERMATMKTSIKLALKHRQRVQHDLPTWKLFAWNAWVTESPDSEDLLEDWITNLRPLGGNDLQYALEEVHARTAPQHIVVLCDGDVRPFVEPSAANVSASFIHSFDHRRPKPASPHAEPLRASVDWSSFAAFHKSTRFHFIALGRASRYEAMNQMAATGRGSFTWILPS